MKQCTRCGSYCQDDAMVCSNCGTPFYQPAPQMPMQPMQPMMNYEPMTVGDWVGTILLSGLGPIGLVLLFVWAFSSDTHPSKKTWARANLIIMAVVIALGIIISLIAGASLAAILSNYR